MIRSIKKIIVIVALFCATAQVESIDKQYVNSLDQSFVNALQITGDASSWYFQTSNQLLDKFHIDDNYQVVVADSLTSGIAVAAWCPFTKCKCLAVNETFLENVPVGVKQVIMAHEVAHMTDFQAFGLKEFFTQMQMGGNLASRVIEEFADKKASLMIACSDCLEEVADFWKQLAFATGRTHKKDKDSESHPAPLRRAKYSRQLAKSFKWLDKCDHHYNNPRKNKPKNVQNCFENMSFDMFKATTEFFESSCITRSYQISLQFGW